jgi:Arc/MetJ family transcription regulator
MRTNIVIDDELLAEAMQYTGLTTKKAVIDEALHTLVRLRRQANIRQLRGQLHWEGDLSASRIDRFLADEPAGYSVDDVTGEPPAARETALGEGSDVDR